MRVALKGLRENSLQRNLNIPGNVYSSRPQHKEGILIHLSERVNRYLHLVLHGTT